MTILIWSQDLSINTKIQYETQENTLYIRSLARSNRQEKGHLRKATPEEDVRQRFIAQLHEWGVPEDSIVIEYFIKMGHKKTFL